MTLSEFNPRLLNFLYELTKLDDYKSSAQIADSVTLENQDKITPKTVRNWFEYLKKPYDCNGVYTGRKLSYFPGFFKNKLGLVTLNVFYQDPSEKLVEILPFKDFVGWLHNPRNNRCFLVVEYVVPKPNLDEFLKILSRIKGMGLCSDFFYHITGPAYRIVSPFHKVIDSNGFFHHDLNDRSEIDPQIKRLGIFLDLKFEVEIMPCIRRNPLIVPVLVEYMYEHRSSLQVWNAIKNKMGDSIWAYFKSSKAISDGAGLKRVQNVMKNLRTLGVLNQMRLVYLPIEMSKNFTVYTIINSNDKEETLEKASILSINSIFTNVFPISEKKTMFVSLMNGDSFQRLFDMFSSSDVEEMMFFDHFKSMHIITTTKYNVFDYTKMFDPKNCSWRYNQQTILSELEDLP